MSRRINKGFADLQAKRGVKSYYDDLTKQNKAIADYNASEKAREKAAAEAYVKKLNANRSHQGNDMNSPDWSLGTVSNYAKWGGGGYTGLGFNMGDRLHKGDKGYEAQQDRLDNYIVFRPEYTTSNRYRGISGYEIGLKHAQHKDKIADKWKGLSDEDKQAAETYDLYFDKDKGEMPTFFTPEQKQDTRKLGAEAGVVDKKALLKDKITSSIKARRPSMVPDIQETPQGGGIGASRQDIIQSISGRNTQAEKPRMRNKVAMINSSDEEDKKKKLIGKLIK